jgi:two-component system, cell cycle sensor histidine kinase and response regulator CckA
MIADRAADSPERVGPQRLPDLKMVRILAVDDDPQARALIDMALTDAPFQYHLEIVPTAASGIRRIAAAEHDVYLIDQQLPDGNGVDLIHRAKAEGITQPFILMTGHGSGALDEAALRGGAADYVEKHMVGAHLERSIRYALRNWQSARALSDREEQLRQAQKMEAIGRLAGAVAHDFNNLLTAIVGYADMIAERENPDDTVRDAGEIRKVADRASALTRQLLAFSRKQFVDPVVLDLNQAIAGLLQVLPRVIGERIHTHMKLGNDLKPIKADPGQVEQMLLNLVLNARDAMPNGGTLTIETAERQIAASARSRMVRPGRYVVLAVSDSGTGMDEEAQSHLFEPFYSTKPTASGAGLGLSIVYGIVKQSRGVVRVTSEPGAGTTVKVYLPVATDDEESQARSTDDTAMLGRGFETVLVVEDEEGVRELLRKVLTRQGYTVIEARHGKDALLVVERHRGPIHLVITDVVMPEMGGNELADMLQPSRPDLKVLYISGYTNDEIVRRGISNSGAAFLQKPFASDELVRKVRELLDARTPVTAD